MEAFEEFPLYILSSTAGEAVNGIHDLQYLFSLQSNQSSSRTIFKIPDQHQFRTYMIWQFPTNDKSICSMKDGLDLTANFLGSKRTASQPFVFDYQNPGDYDSVSKEELDRLSSFLIVITPISSSIRTVTLSQQEFRALCDNEEMHHDQAPRRLSWHRSQYIVTEELQRLISVWKGAMIICLIVALLLAFIFAWQRRAPGVQNLQASSGTIGPEHSYIFTEFNLTDWAQKTPSHDEDFYLRYDDQSLIPMALLTDEERKFQDWFKRRYPEQVTFVQQLDHLDENWLNSNQSTVPADKQFHIAHCFLSFWRYWIAKESGHHVCTWDLDHGHIHHCLTSLQEWALPDGPRQVQDRMPLRWNTKICF